MSGSTRRLRLRWTIVLLAAYAKSSAAYPPRHLLQEEQAPAPDQQQNITVVALAHNTSGSPILLSPDAAYSWQFIPYRNSTLRLLSVINTQFNTTTVVWTANRNKPVSPNAALLFSIPSRQYLLQETNDSQSSSSAIAWSSPDGVYGVELNSSGNLLMLDSNHSIFWQSFDYPTDTMVAGQFLRTHKSLVSSISDEDLSEGTYSLTVEAGGVVFYADLGEPMQTKVPYQFFTYSYNYVGGNGGADATGTSGGNLTEALHSACNRTYIVFSSDGVQVSLLQEGDVITPECVKETAGFTTHGTTFTTMTGGVTGFRYLRLMPDGDVQTFLISDTTGLVSANEPGQGFFSSYCQLPSFCGVNSLCSSYDTCSCPDGNLFAAMDPASNSAENGFGGCVLITSLDCSAPENHQFFEISAADYFANAYHPNPISVASAAACTDQCRPNCSCTAAFFDNSTATCYLYERVYTMQAQANPSVTAFLRVARLPVSAASSSSAMPKAVIIGISIGVATSVAILFVALLAVWISKKHSKFDEDDSEEEAFLEALPGLPPRFSYAELHSATQGFSKKLGIGASGAVYEGCLLLQNPTIPEPEINRRRIMDDEDSSSICRVAVKELHVSSGSSAIATVSKKQFRAEVATLCGVSHVNLVQLRGFCAEAKHRLLVYEFMENGSLDRWIFSRKNSQIKEDGDGDEENGSSRSREFDRWEIRYRIAVDMARGLAFLHEGCRDKVLHLDVKPQNVLLDGGFRAKLSDFGGSKLIERKEKGDVPTQTLTAMRGTPGYMAPEWFLNLPVTEKSDVFSYGMVLLELVGGRKNADLRRGAGDGGGCGDDDDDSGAGDRDGCGDGRARDADDQVQTEFEEDDWYFPAIVAKKVANGDDMATIADRRMIRLMSGKDKKEQESTMASLSRLINVALWCIQEDAASRPSMSTVLLMLEEHLQVPTPPLHLHYIPRHHRLLQRRHSQSSTTTFNTISSTRSVIPR